MSKTNTRFRYSIFQACLVSVIAVLTDLGFMDLEVWFSDIEITKRVLSQVSGRNEQAWKFLNVINQLCPESAGDESSNLRNLAHQAEASHGLHTQCMSVLHDQWPAFIN